MGAETAGGIRIRPAEPADAPAVARLASQLGYPSGEEAIVRRLAALAGGGDAHTVLVSLDAAGSVTGWVHVSVERTVESDPYAEIRGLVVDEAHRSRGIGAELVRAAVAWSRARGLGKVRVRSNVVRERTRAFYLALGFGVVKTQSVFDLDLRAGGGVMMEENPEGRTRDRNG